MSDHAKVLESMAADHERVGFSFNSSRDEMVAALEAGASALRQRACARCKFWREGDAAKTDGWCEPLNRGTARAFFCGFWEEAD